MAKLGRPRTLFLAAIMAITASTAAGMLSAPAWAAPAVAGGRTSATVGASSEPTLKLVTRPATAANTGYSWFISVHSIGDNGLLSPDQCLSIYGDLNNEQAVQYFCADDNDKEWALGSEWGSSGFYQLIDKNGQCLGVGGASKAVDADVVGWNCLPTHPDQYWGFYELYQGGEATGYYAIRNLNSGYYLTVFNGYNFNNADIVQDSWQDVDWQWWLPCNGC